MLSCIKNFEQKMYSDENYARNQTRQSAEPERDSIQALVCQKDPCKILKVSHREQLRLMESPASDARGHLKSKFDELNQSPVRRLAWCPIDCIASQFSVKKALAVHRRYCEKNLNDLLLC
jgi:hypothetical protein